MTKNYKILLWIAVFCFLTVTGWAREQIADFHSSIEVHYDSTMTVTETITVRAEGQKIRRGIYRDFPTKYKDRLGNQVVVGFEVKSVLRDGLSESYHIKAMSNGQRVYIGKENYFLPRGEYTYTLTYTTNRQLGFFEDHDELYWNVTGNDWDFPIKQASAVVSLPSDAAEKIIGVDAFTGRYSSVGKDFVFRRDVFGNPAFVTTRTLSSGEGLTIAISWPKGYVEEPKVWDKVGYFVRDNKPVVVTLGGLMLLLLYYLNIWNLIGRDPEKGTIIPLYDAPKGFSPASSRYIMKMEYDDKVLTAAVINMAVKGFIKIRENTTNIFTLSKTGVGFDLLSHEEQVLASNFFSAQEEIVLGKKQYRSRLIDAVDYFKEALIKKAEQIYFVANKEFFIVGLVLTGMIIVFSFNSLQNGVFSASPFVFVVLWLIIGGINLLFYHLLKAPTIKGRKLMDKLEGLKMYLSIAEKDRLNWMNPPDKTPELFEKFLPYALALGVEQEWSEYFSDFLNTALHKGYRPYWYEGDRWSTGVGFSRIFSGFTEALSTVISASVIPPGSSSGFGGGGFSGGGGGGGGGGGW